MDHRGFPHVESLGQFVGLNQTHVAPFFLNSERFLTFGAEVRIYRRSEVDRGQSNLTYHLSSKLAMSASRR
ncbi:hypothetical protein [Cutibacterium acnes]|uniref:hypothetical protein n=1 Tax=Cutibacterium acnes TaxID=1747 RepID=UPI000AC3312E